MPRLRWTLSLVGILIYVFTVTTYRVPVADVGIVIALIGLLTERPKLKVPRFLLWFGAFVVWGAMGLAWTRYPTVTQEQVVFLTKIWLISFAVCNTLRDQPKITAYILFFLFCFATHAGRGSIQNYITGNTLSGRAVWNGEFANPNLLAGIALLQLAMAAAVLTVDRRKLARWFAIGCLALIPVVVLFTQSRSNFIGLVLFGLLGLSSVKGRKRVRIAGAIAGLAVIAVLLAPSGVWERVRGLSRVSASADMRDVDPEGSAAERYLILSTGLTILEAHPITGTGLKTYSRMNAEYAPDLGRKDAHNTFLSVAVETGLIGLVLFMGMIVAAIRPERRRGIKGAASSPMVSWLRNGLLAFLVAGLWATVSGLLFFYLHLALLWAAMQLRGQEPELQASVGSAPEGVAHFPSPDPRVIL